MAQAESSSTPHTPGVAGGCWHAVFCRPRQESRAAWHLRNQGFAVLLPRMKVRRRASSRGRIEAMFPRYVFARADAGADLGTIRSTRGAIGLVRFGGHLPTVPSDVIDAIAAQLDADECLQAPAADELKPGEPVCVVEGPFAGALARFAGRGSQGRVAVLLELMQRESRVEMDPALIRRA
jgi:transcriptional antiterminator RfaH